MNVSKDILLLVEMKKEDKVVFLNKKYGRDPYIIFEAFSSEITEVKDVCSFCNVTTKSKMKGDEILCFCESCRAVEPETYTLIEIPSLEIGFNNVTKKWVSSD
jgi:hypothetical protein